MSRQEDLQNLIAKHTRRLQKLREQEAGFGPLHTPAHIFTEIEDTEAEIQRLQAELATVEETEKESPQPKLAASPAVATPVGPTVAADPQMVALRAQPRIFLCHASEDKHRVRELYHQLRDAGYRPWLDKIDLLPGQRWESTIKKIITNLNNIILVCLSNNSTTKQGVVQQEIKWALDILDQMPEDTIYLIPARLEECQPPDRLSGLHWVDLFEPDGFEYLTQALNFEINKRQPELTSEEENPQKQSFDVDLSFFYRLDEDLEPIAKVAIANLDAPISFDANAIHRVYITNDDFIDYFTDKSGRNRIDYHFWEICEPEEIEAFHNKVRSSQFLDLLSGLLGGGVAIEWGGPNSSYSSKYQDVEHVLTIYYDNKICFTYLSSYAGDQISYRGMIQIAKSLTSWCTDQLTKSPK